MAVYVDDMAWTYRGMIMYHMIADSHEELIQMAFVVGVKQKWIQYEGTYREHFDVCKQKRALAIQFGAIAITQRELAKMVVDKREKKV